MKRVILLVCLMVCAHFVSAQTVIRGVVVDNNNQPVMGASVMVDGASNAVVTDFDGAFEISVEEGSKLSIAMLGYRSVEQAAAQDMVVVLRKKGAGSSADGWRMFIMANGAYSPQQKTMGGVSGYGFTLGMFKTAGWYASFMMGPQFKLPKYGDNQFRSTDVYGEPINFKDMNSYLYTGNMKVCRWSGTVGFVAGKTVYFYAGVGYGRRSLLCEAYNFYGEPNYWIPEQSRTSILNGMMWECGILADIKGFGLSVGADCLTDFNNTAFWEIKVGLGGCFNVKGAKK